MAWTLDDIPWRRFEPAAVDPDLLRLAKAASLVEYNGAAYAHHLCLIFADDPEFQQDARRWGEEEIQHGRALARWAALADPGFDFAAVFDRFREGFRVNFECGTSRRGSRAGEMIARCIVETGTSSYYTALREAAREPVLKEICRQIAADELRHYKLFYRNLERCLGREPIGRVRRLLVALGRVAEARDDELAYAYFAANDEPPPYDRRQCARAYARRASALYRPHHVERGVAMILKTVGVKPNGRIARLLAGLAWRAMRRQSGAGRIQDGVGASG
ncbi:MAG TPA: ferritin-like domain-containing protein [Stellaceae bacterium]|nr:ferritin-like domain-containing protein [Stellaceae bacterium]